MTILSTLLTYRLATEKGLNVKFWVIMAIIFGLVVLPFIFLAKNNYKENVMNERNRYLEA